ncbi:MAG TPA: cell division protein ZapA [Gammaproteobacteria bacterium]|nr:cell division protein ZapA [Gammaproteobacteria bacterium]HBF08628.1 cell division protein ZapA [Gammaproteobacteria bacterium]HCK91820.1 cell division protein ZapA [Gammaproteobacteria bacterium]|tara:strand:- start:491 stop:868 length:378 start_codon:yes stop_codon:yes gene_type:complete
MHIYLGQKPTLFYPSILFNCWTKDMNKERANTTVTLNILGKEFKVACPKEKESDLLHAARVLSDRMRALRNPSGTASIDRIAIIAALNVTDELEKVKQELKAVETKAQDQLDELMKRVDSALEDA